MMKFSLILAVDDKNGIWKDGDLAWKLPWDMKYFKDITTKTSDLSKFNAVIMWRKTRESIPSKYRPLADRVNCILTSKKNSSTNHDIDDFVLYYNDFEKCITDLSTRENIESIFVIWWANLYNSVLSSPNLDKIYLTKVSWNFDCDVFFDWVPEDFSVESYTDDMEENDITYSFWVYKKEIK